MHGASLVVDLGLVLAVAALMSVVTRWLRQPTILGYLFAGLIVGPYIPIPIFADPHRIETLAELGVVLVMFAVGLEFRIETLLRVLPTSGLTGVVEVGFMVWCGFTLGQLLGWTIVASVFLGASIAISSTMVVSKVFAQSKVPGAVKSHVLGVLVVQDVLAIVLIAVTTGVAAGGGLGPKDLLLTLGRLGGLLFVLVVAGLFVVPPIVRRVASFASKEILVVVALGLCFALAIIAEHAGYSVALGAFIGGILVAESGHGHDVEHVIEPMRDVFAALFFVSIGMTVDPRQALQYIDVSLIVFALVIGGQLFIIMFVGLASGSGFRRSIVAALSLGQIGEFAFIIAGIGRAAGVVPDMLQPVLVTVAVLTAFTTPMVVNNAERIADRLEAHLPRRLFVLLQLYETWREWLGRRRSAAGRAFLVRTLRAIALDAIALIVFLTFVLAWRPDLLAWASSLVGPSRGPWLVTAGVLGVALPILLALISTSTRLSRHLAQELLPADQRTSETAKVVVRLLRGIVHLLVLLGVGVPAVAVLRPVLGAPLAAPLLAAAVLAFMAYLWRASSVAEHELASGTERIAAAFVDRTGQPPAPKLPALERITSLTVAASDGAVGRTLADLDLRRRTGATVISILRADDERVLPTGHEVLRAGDVLGIAGDDDAFAAAKKLLEDTPTTHPPE
ncbi:MAG: cation:proton antiporter [Deltaproteobacteria bacterium]